MKLITILLFIFCMQVSATGISQQVSLKEKNAPLEKLFKQINQQTGYLFFYNQSWMNETKKVNIDVKDVSLDEVLKICFYDQPLSFEIVDKTIVVKQKPVLVVDDGIKTNLPINIKGRIVDENGEPVQGASVTITATNKGTSTNKNGEFNLYDVPENSSILVTGVNIKTQEIKLSGKDFISVTITREVKEEREIVVAYRTTTQKANTGAVTVVKGEQIRTQPNMSFDKSLQGLVPGLVVTTGSGQPGSMPSNFILRGIATGGNVTNGEAYRNPMVIIDGIPVAQDPIASPLLLPGGVIPAGNPMAHINPSDIESISVLKDAAATSLYGSKASNGVLVITTKKGKAGKSVISFRHQTNIAERMEGKLKMLNQEQYLELLKDGFRNSRPGITDAEILSDLRSDPDGSAGPEVAKFPSIVRSPGDTAFYPIADWTNALYNKNAPSITNELSFSGGSPSSTFYLNFEHTKQNGVIRTTDYDRKSLRFNVDNRLKSWLKVGVNSMLSYNVQHYVSELFTPLISISPLLPIRDENNDYFFNYSFGLGQTEPSLKPNPAALLDFSINRNTFYRGNTAINATVYPFKFLTLSSTVGVDFYSSETLQKEHPNLAVSSTAVPGFGMLREQNIRNMVLIATNTAQFNKMLGKDHSTGILLGQEAQTKTNKAIYAEKYGIADNPSVEDVFQATSSSFKNKQTQLSYFTQFNYGFRDKLFLSGTVRRDGSSQFGANNKFGTYWSAGAGWLLSEEKFIKNNFSWINQLKIRGSVGSSGNSSAIIDIYKFDFLQLVSYLNKNVAIGGDFPGNRNIQWESTVTWDGGIEMSFLKNRISFVADYYLRKTTNLIADNIPLPPATGAYEFHGNIGDIKNTGIELTLNAGIVRSKSFGWNMNIMWSRNSNKLTRSLLTKQQIFGQGNIINEVGREYNSFYLPEWYGVNLENGRPMWMDSVSGKPTEVYYEARKKIAGKTQPDGIMSVTNSFAFKGFDCSFQLYCQYGSQIYFGEGAYYINDGLFPYNNQTIAALNRWRKPGDKAANPRRLLSGTAPAPGGGLQPDDGTIPSTRYIFDGDFIRLSTINLGYTINAAFLQKLKITLLKIYVQANNLATWTPYKGGDPENITTYGTSVSSMYPIPRSFSAGLQLNF